MKKVLINAEERELRVAILEDDQLVELYIESLDEKSILNNIYKGRIEGIIPGLKAAFVNIGLERNAFMHFDDVRQDLLLAKGGMLPAPSAPVEEITAEREPVPAARKYAPAELDEEDEAEEQAASGVEGEESDEDSAGKRRRRRGRRGGRRRREQELEAAGGEPGAERGGEVPVRGEEAEEEVESQPAAQQFQQPQQSQQSSRKDRRRDRRRDRGGERGGDRDRDRHQGSSQPSPGNAWVPPPAGAERGTRAASNPYQDVFSPYAQQQGRRRWRKDQPDDRSNSRGGARSGAPRGESQEDFFPPPPRPRTPEFEDGDEMQPHHLRVQPAQSHADYDEEADGPQPGNEKNPSQGQGRQQGGGGGKKRRRRPGGRGRSMKKPGGSSYFAVRAKKTAEEKPSEEEKPKKPARRKTAAAAEEKPAEAKPKRSTKAKAAAAPVEEQPAAEAKPKRTTRKKAEPVETAPAEAPVARKSAAKRSAAKVSPAKEVETPAPKAETPAPGKPARTRKKAAAEPTKEAPELTATNVAEVPAPEEAPAKKAPARRKKAEPAVQAPPPAAEEVVPAAQAPAAEVTAPPESAPAAPAARTRDRGRGRGRARKSAAVEAPPQTTEDVSAVQEEAAPAESETAQPVAAQPEGQPGEERAPRGRRNRRGRGRRGEAHAAPSAQDLSGVSGTEAPDVVPAPPDGQQVEPAQIIPIQPEARQRPPRREHEKGRDREQDRRPERHRVPRFTDVFHKGDEVMVQVVKEEIGMKGARISTYVSLPGRYLVMLPYPNEEGGVSRKVEDMSERKRLKRILRDISANDEHAFIVRTAGIDRDEEEIAGDVEFLRNEWKNIDARFNQAKPGELVYDDHNILYRLARDVFDDNIGEILVDSPQVADQLRGILGKLIPDLMDRVQVYDEPENIFHKFQVEKQITKAARRKVWLKSGGYIIIDEAEALTAIDVNSGKFVGKDDQEKMILKTNLEAGKTIARELKLRDIGGLIVVDFIDMKDQRNRDQLLVEFRQHFRKDRSKTSISSVSEFGLVEMTRKRVRRSLRKTLFMDCPYCQGAGVILNEQQIWLHIKHEVLRLLEAGQPYPPSLSVTINPRVRTYIDQNYRDTISRLEKKYGVEIRMLISDVFHMENYAIEKLSRQFPAAPAALSGSAGGAEEASGGR